MSLRFLVPAVLAPLLAQCQGDVDALRYATFVPFSGTMAVWHNPGYETDVLWFPDQGVGCVVMREPGNRNPGCATTPWFVHADRTPPLDCVVCESVRVPRALALRIVALVRQALPEEQQRREMAEEGRKAGLFRIGMSDLERALGTWR